MTFHSVRKIMQCGARAGSDKHEQKECVNSTKTQCLQLLAFFMRHITQYIIHSQNRKLT